MVNELLLFSTLMNMQQASVNQVPFVQQYAYPDQADAFDSIIHTCEVSIKNAAGAYPWEVVKIYEGGTYYLYKNYFRIGGKINKESKMYHYFQNMNHKRKDITRRLMNPNDYRKILYFNMDNIISILPYKIAKMYRGNSNYCSRLVGYWKTVLDLQKEYLELQQAILDLNLLAQNLLDLYYLRLATFTCL